MNNKFIDLKKDIDSIGADYRAMKSIADSLATQNIRTSEALRKSSLEPKLVAKKVNEQWFVGITMYLWSRFVFFVLFEQ